MKLNAKSRLLAADAGADATKKAKEGLDNQIENKKKQVEHLKRSMPSRQNRQSESPVQRNTTEKQINRTKESMSDLRLRKSEIGKH
jgi:peptidoglycan hydrolase CwlO-like protein